MTASRVAARFDRALRFVEDALWWIAGAIMLAMMALTAVDVAMRYVWQTPLAWAFDLLTNYLLAASFFFAFSAALRLGDHVAVDFFAPKFPPVFRGWLLAAAWLACSGIVGVIAWSAIHESWLAWSRQEVIAGTIPWPVWPAKAVIALGLTPMVLRLLVLAVRSARCGAPLPGHALDVGRVEVQA